MAKIQAPTLSSMYEDDEKFGWLDSIADPVQQTANRIFDSVPFGRNIKSMLNGTPLRHRLHPAIVVVPIGAWTVAVIFDVLSRRATGSSRLAYQQAADVSVLCGIVSSVPAIKTGVADWVDLYDHRRRVGMAHALMNATGLSLFGASLALRKCTGDSRGLAQVLSGAGFAVVGLGGAVGGELVYTLGVNVPHTVYPKPPNEPVDVLASEDLGEGETRVVEVGRVPVLLVRRDGDVFAVDAWCPHAGGPLYDGELDGDVIECPWHQSRFCVRDGAPLQGPATVPLRTFAVSEEGGRISVEPSYEGSSWPPPPEPISAET